MEVVSALRTALADQVGVQRFALWFGPGTRLEFDGQVLSIGVPNRFFLEWIRGTFRSQIEAACLAVLGRSVALEFHVDTSLGESQSPPQANAGDSAEDDALRARPACSAPTAENPQVHEPRANGSPRRKFASLESFFGGQTNRLAQTSAEMVLRRLGQFSPLTVFGPTGVGKTHLLEGIWTAAQKLPRKPTVIYLTAEQFTSCFLEALDGRGLPSFRRKYRGVGLLIVDDLQFLSGKRATLVELLNTVDTLLRDGRQLVFAADRPPAELGGLGRELVTRLESGLICPIEPPDYPTRLGIVAQMARQMNIALPPEVQQFIAARLTSHARELSGALCRLQATREATGQPLGLAMAEQSLADMIRSSGRMVRLADVEKAVCQVFGLQAQSLHCPQKGRRISHPRMLAMWLARKHTRAALSEIGQFFGGRSHSTVISAQKRVDDWMARRQVVQLAELTCPVDEAIRQVERLLTAG